MHESTDKHANDLQHPWDVTPAEAVAIQNRLRERVICEDTFAPVQRVAGVDIGFEDQGATTRAAVVVLDFPALTIYESALSRRPTSFPYIPGLLSFREIPATLDALAQLSAPPDLLLVDGHGRIHPRRLGIACHLGLLSGIPAIGVGKSPFVGQHEPLANTRGAWQPIRDKGDTIGAVLRTRVNVKPIYVSTGHCISLQSAIGYVLRCTPRYRLPETTRQAHNLASCKVSR
jgi:deoxyribonuclease V